MMDGVVAMDSGLHPLMIDEYCLLLLRPICCAALIGTTMPVSVRLSSNTVSSAVNVPE
jgi:hypothetical protein